MVRVILLVMVVVEVDVLMLARMLLLNTSLAVTTTVAVGKMIVETEKSSWASERSTELTSVDDVGTPEVPCATLLLESSSGDVNVS